MQRLRDVYVRQALSDGFSEHWSGPPEMVERIAGVLETRPWHRVLDVGCGLGGPARRLAGAVGCRVVGVDVVEEVLRAAAARTEADVAVRYVVGEAARLPVRDGGFDQVWSLGALAHLPEPVALATECARVLTPGGSVAITEAFWDGRRAPRFAESAPQPWRPVTPEETAGSLREAGLDRVRVLPWPGREAPAVSVPADRALAADLTDGRLVPLLVVAERP